MARTLSRAQPGQVQRRRTPSVSSTQASGGSASVAGSALRPQTWQVTGGSVTPSFQRVATASPSSHAESRRSSLTADSSSETPAAVEPGLPLPLPTGRAAPTGRPSADQLVVGAELLGQPALRAGRPAGGVGRQPPP